MLLLIELKQITMSIGKRFLFLVILVVTVRVVNAQFSLQNCVVERFTGSWVTYEPDAYLYLDTVIQHHPRAIPVAVHVGDSMEINDGIMIQSFYTLAYPTATMNRTDYSISRSLWDAPGNIHSIQSEYRNDVL